MTRTPALWIAFAIASLVCAVFAYGFFPRAFPIVSLEITLSRSAALERAAALAGERGWGPAGDAQSAASFDLDDEVQTFVELEGGGAVAFNALLHDPVYSPYAWRVRRFREGEVNETSIYFRPDGRLLGFAEKIAEDAARLNLPPDAARALGERNAAELRIDLGSYTLVESGQEQRPNGRVDHVFTYEREAALLGAGRHRVRISVSGDRVSEIMPGVRVPEAFRRRYEEMRSANTAIGAAGSVGAMFLYLLIGCGAGCFYLLRRRALLWRPAAWLAAGIAAAVILAELNQWPLRWLQYDTALPAGRYMVQTLLPIVILGLALGAVMALTFMTAEGLSRLAFPEHPQFWAIWRPAAAPTAAIAGRTAAGYLAMPLLLAYVMLFYFAAGRLWGWWNPAESLVNPDSLAHYLPWFTPFAMALQAGVWEECLFRAVPLAGAALIGRRLGRRGLCIGLALVLQALIFGAAHATYPAQPAYARLVELILPSLVFGLFYLRYGLLPGIVLHFTFDIVLMALPVYASAGTGVWVDRALVVILTLLPALVIAWRRLSAGRWLELPAELRNAALAPPAPHDDAPRIEPPAPHAASPLPSALPRWIIPALAAFSIVALPLGVWRQYRSQPEVPVLDVTRTQAAQIARDALTERGAALPSATRMLVRVLGEPDIGDRFIWQTAGRDVYESLIGDWLHPPRYLVRFARFEGELTERAEEWVVTVTRHGVVRTVRHTLAEGAPGANLNEEQARGLALAGLERELKVNRASVREVSVEPKKQPARTDWTITYADAAGAPLPQGERRLRVDIAGDEVVGAVKSIHVPEAWERQQRAADVPMNILSVLRALALLGIGVAGSIMGIRAWVRGLFRIRCFLLTVLTLAVIGGASLANEIWPTVSARFSTAQPFAVQGAVNMALSGLLLVTGAVAAGLIAGMVVCWRRSGGGMRAGQLVLAGILWAAALRALASFAALPFGTTAPRWPATAPAASYIPALTMATSTLVAFSMYTLLALLVFGAADRYTSGWTRRRKLAMTLLFLLGAISYGSTLAGTLTAWATSALVMGLATAGGYWLLIRRDLAVIPVVSAASIVFGLIPLGQQPFPGAAAGALLAAAAIAAVGGWSFAALRRNLTPG
jgi:hypothetical protein